MSVASSAASCRDVLFQGQEMTLEQALDKTFKDVQGGLNSLQRNLEQLAVLEEQFLEDSDYKRAVELEDSTTDLTSMLTELLSELPEIAGDIRGPPPDSLKIWYKEHKLRRKAMATAEKERRKAAADAAKAAAKAAKEAEA